MLGLGTRRLFGNKAISPFSLDVQRRIVVAGTTNGTNLVGSLVGSKQNKSIGTMVNSNHGVHLEKNVIQQRRHLSISHRNTSKMTGIPTVKTGDDAEETYDGFGTPHFRRVEAIEHPILERKASSMSRTASIKSAVKQDGKGSVTDAAGEATGTAAIKSDSTSKKMTYDEHTWSLPAVNHLWTPEEIRHALDNQPKYEPKTIGDRIIRFGVQTLLYRGFNYFSGFNYEDPSPRACAFRLIMLESIAGIPGMVAGVVRHFASLRTLRRDNGWIYTLFEEAQNERMHLMVCLKMFDAGILCRFMVVAAQFVMVPFMFGLYLVHPRSMHRFVGYLEETACKTYSDLIRITKQEGTQLNKSWGNVRASNLAIAYWNLKEDAMWLDVLEQLLADESHHRDVNHAFADLHKNSPNPFIAGKMADTQRTSQRKALFVDETEVKK